MQKQFNRLFNYDPDTGVVTNRCRRGNRAAWALADKGNGYGYLRVGVDGKRYLLHRVIWVMLHGYWPEQIDHINGNRSDNRLVNLRAVTNADNCRNKRQLDSNTSGCTGVNFEANRWRARIHMYYDTVHLGRFDNFLDACAARKAAELKYGFHRNHGRNE